MSEAFSTAVKEAVADPTQGPMLHGLLNAEAGRLIEALRGEEFSPSASVSDEEIVARLDRYRELTAALAHAFAWGNRWAGVALRPLWTSLLERITAGLERRGGGAIWIDLSHYPAVLLLYGGGMGRWSASASTTFLPCYSARGCFATTAGTGRSRSLSPIPLWTLDRPDVWQACPTPSRL